MVVVIFSVFLSLHLHSLFSRFDFGRPLSTTLSPFQWLSSFGWMTFVAPSFLCVSPNAKSTVSFALWRIVQISTVRLLQCKMFISFYRKFCALFFSLKFISLLACWQRNKRPCKNPIYGWISTALATEYVIYGEILVQHSHAIQTLVSSFIVVAIIITPLFFLISSTILMHKPIGNAIILSGCH